MLKNIGYYALVGILAILLIVEILPDKTQPKTVADQTFSITVNEKKETYASLYAFAKAKGTTLNYIGAIPTKKLFTVEYTLIYDSPYDVVKKVMGPEVANTAIGASPLRYSLFVTRPNPPMWYVAAILITLLFMGGFITFRHFKDKKPAVTVSY